MTTERSYRTPEITHRPLMDHRLKEETMTVLIRNEYAFSAVCHQLKPAHFTEYERMYALVWRIVLEHHEAYGVLPACGQLESTISSAYNDDPSLLSDLEITELNEFIAQAYADDRFARDITTDTLYAEWAIDHARKLLQERIALATTRSLMHGNRVIVDLPALLEQYTSAAQEAAAMTADAGINDLFPPGWDKQTALNLFPTGIPFMDVNYLGGGHAPGEVYGLMGPFGSCKTTLACMLAVQAAYHFNNMTYAPDYDGRPTVAFLVTYEAPCQEIRARTLGYAAGIIRASLEQMKDIGDLSRGANYREYEKACYAKQLSLGDNVPAEFERANAKIPILRQHLVHIDMTGNSVRGAGNNGMSEIEQRIALECRKRNAKCGLVVVDYIGALVKRMIGAGKATNQDMRHLINGAALQAKNKLALPHGCPAWLLHQLSGDANSMAPGRLPDGTNAAESKSWEENLDFNFCVGNPDEENKALFGCTKHRRTRPNRETCVIRIQGAFNRVRDVSELYFVDTSRHVIMLRSEADNLPGIDAMSRPRRSGHETMEDIWIPEVIA